MLALLPPLKMLVITYIGWVYVPDDKEVIYIKNSEAAVNQEGDWNGIALVVGVGTPQHGPS